ncbi:MAG: hypothetical protein B7Y80_05455 [Hyphomicrobium sp. 32-62-53]|nr:MAG: hypothetical protein B7Y80_05455 [Hyphomicrobium sp. 32-62-53]
MWVKFFQVNNGSVDTDANVARAKTRRTWPLAPGMRTAPARPRTNRPEGTPVGDTPTAEAMHYIAGT